MTPGQVAQAQQLLSSIPWFDNNPLASEYLDVKNWSPWDWVQFGGSQRNPAPLQAGAFSDGFTPGQFAVTPQYLAQYSGDFQPNPVVLEPQSAPYNGPFTFLAEIRGAYALELQKSPTPGKPATNVVLYVRQDEVRIKLFIITPFDLTSVGLLLQSACSIFPPATNQGVSKIIPIFHPKLQLAARQNFILVSMGYVEEPRHGNPGYVDTIWVPQDDITTTENQVVTIGPSGIINLQGPVPTATAATAMPPSASNPDYFYDP